MNEEQRNEQVAESLDNVALWVDEYVESSDYGDSYAYIAVECSHDWPKRIEQWLETESSRSYDNAAALDGMRNDKLRKHIAALMAERLDDYNIEAVYHSNEYAAYSGDGCCLYAMEIGEHEEQLELEREPLLLSLHESGELESALAAYRGYAYVSAREHYDKERGKRVHDSYVHSYKDGVNPHLMLYFSPGGQWQYVVSSEDMQAALAGAIIDYCRRVDAK